MQTILLWFSFFGAALTVPTCVILWMREKGFHPFSELLTRYRRLPVLVRLAVLAVAAHLFVYGSTKTNQTDQVDGGTTNDTGLVGGPQSAPRRTSPAPCAPSLPDFTPEQLAAGFVKVKASTNETWDFSCPAGAHVVERWRMRGACDDWWTLSDMPAVTNGFYAPLRPRVLFAGGFLQDDVRAPTVRYSPLEVPLGIVPAANDGMIVREGACGQVWYAVSASNSLLVTWQDALVGRDTNLPVSVQAEFFENGDFTYRYDLSRAGAAVSNACIGAWCNGQGEALTADDLDAPLAALTSVSFKALDPRDAQTADRDGDGIRTYDEIFVTGTDPSLPDTDGDGLLDGQEIVRGLDPFSGDSDGDGLVDGSDPDPLNTTSLDDLDADGLPDAYERHWFGGTDVRDTAENRDETGFTLAGKIAAGVNPTNEASASCTVVSNAVVSCKLWDAFDAAWQDASTNLVYERTVTINRTSNWQQYFLSSRPDSAGGWALSGLTLEWEDSCGASGCAIASPVGDSFWLPVSTNSPQFVTVRLRANAGRVRSTTPVYLIAYAPEIKIKDGLACTAGNGTSLHVYMKGSESVITVEIDRSLRPCKSSLHSGERYMDGLTDMVELSDGRFTYEGGLDGGVIKPKGPGIYELPQVGVKAPSPRRLMKAAATSGSGNNPVILVLLPSVWYGTHACHATAGVGYEEEKFVREFEYPLDSGCLWQEWRRDVSGAVVCDCIPGASCGLPEDNGYASVVTEVSPDEIEATIVVGGETVWSGTAKHEWFPGTGCGMTSNGLRLIDSCGECEGCESGNCFGNENVDMKSMKFRIPVGAPRKGQVSGFVYLDAEQPLAITPDVFQYLFRGDANVSVVTNGSSRRIACADPRGRDVAIDAEGTGVRIVITEHGTDTLDHRWDVFNVNGDTNVVRFVKTSRLDNVMEDWTFSHAFDADADAWRWRKLNNVTGLAEDLYVDDRLNVDGFCQETRIQRDATGCELSRSVRRSSIVGEWDASVLRDTYYCEIEAGQEIVREAEYWRDTEHRARNGQLKLMTANDRPWEYHEWDKDGHELLRVEQRNGSPVPAAFPSVSSNGLTDVSGLIDACLTTYEYEPLPGDDCNAEDGGRVRCESRYVAEGGGIRLIGRTWRRYTHVTADGRPAVREETWRVGSASSAFDAPGNAYSSRTTFAERGAGVPLVLRGELAEEIDENGVRTEITSVAANGFVTRTTRKSLNGVAFPAYEVNVLDDNYGLTVRTATCLTENDVVIAEELSTYDNQSRLRSTTFLDGTSLTNAYSCCRKLWSRDRQGRKTLRSARTGTDHLYYADEEVWLQDVSSNGYKVTQHFLDGFGRETNTVVYVGTVPGEAVEGLASSGQELTVRTSHYSGTGFGDEQTVDERGLQSWRTSVGTAECETTEESSWSDEAAGEWRRDTDVRNGPRVTRREWDGKWTERRTWDDYDASGCRVAYEVTESSDYGVVTNAVTWYDFLGREIARQTPEGVTTSAYDGTTGRVTESTFTAEDVVRTTTNLYDACGEKIGTALDGVVRRRETTYEGESNVWWKVTRESTVGSRTNATSVTREQLTDLSDACRARTVSVSAAGVRTESTTSFDADTGLETRTVVSSVGGTATTVSRCGLVLSTTTDDGTSSREYDALGRVVCESRTVGTNETILPVRETQYDAFGDAVAVFSYTNATDGVLETAVYDAFGRCVEKADANGAVTTMAYDAQGNLIASDGATVPTRSEYDTAGRRTSLSTTRDGILWDVTTWEYDPGTGKCLKKRQSDGGETVRTYTPDGLESLVTHPSLQWCENVYDERRRLVGTVSNDGSENAAYGYEEFGQLTSASNAESVISFARHCGGVATNECVRIGTNAVVFVRTVDAFGRLSGGGREGAPAQSIAYATANRPAAVSDPSLTVTYAYTPDGYEAGGSSVFSGGAAIRREVCRDVYRPNLVLSVSNYVNNALVSSYDYAHDALGQSIRCNDDAFTYDSRRQLTSSHQTSQTFQTFSYDHTGNFTETVDVNGTNVWTANALNQYASAGEMAFSYTRDGGMSSDGRFDYAFDSGNRLTSVSTGGVTLATFAYDALSRRVRKTTPEATHLYFYDGWNLVLERIERADGTVDEIEYFWGKDLSGTFGTAGGVGGLLYLRENGMEYAPLYDANGNVMQYVDRTGTVVASYVYDAFGRTLAATGPLADRFRIRFSTKYHDPETGLVYYGYRFYAPAHARWLTPDPLEEQGGLNLYAFCANNPVNGYDALGLFVNPLTGPGAFAFWEFVADAFFEAYDRSPVSAEMLRISVWRLFGTEPHVFSGHSKLAAAIKNSPEYKKIIDDKVDPLPLGKKDPFSGNGDVHFGSHDLVSSVGDAKWRFSGNVCKSSATSAKLDLKVTVEDTYNFEWWGEYKEKIYGWFLTLGNNDAHIFQEVGVLRTYKWEVTFDDGRMWKW